MVAGDCPAVHEAALLPGNEVPLAVATEGGERLAVCLSGSGKYPAPHLSS